MTKKLTKILIIPSLMLAFSASAAEPAAQPPANQISISADRQEGQRQVLHLLPAWTAARMGRKGLLVAVVRAGEPILAPQCCKVKTHGQ